MILQEINQAYKIYDSLIKQVENGTLNPLDIDINLFLENLSKDEDIKNSAIFVKLSTELLKLKAENLINLIFPEKESKKITKNVIEKKIFETLKEETGFDEDILNLLMEESIREKLKKPRFIKVKKISKEEFLKISKENLKESLSKDVDYNNLAKEILEKIKSGKFKIKSIQDFIGLMFAIYNYNLEIKDIKQFL